MKKCVQCGRSDSLKQDTETHKIVIGVFVVSGAIPAIKCTYCDETYVHHQDMQSFEKSFLEEVEAWKKKNADFDERMNVKK